MSVGLGIFLIVIGAILTFAVGSSSITFIDATMVGYILMAGGTAVTLIGLTFILRKRKVSSTTRTVDGAGREGITEVDSSIR